MIQIVRINMTITLSEGNFTTMGAAFEGEGVCFTFEADKEMRCRILLFDRASKDLIEAIDVPGEYCIGSLRSVTVTGPDFSACMYLYEIDGKRVLDPYAKRIIGREKWHNLKRANDNFSVYAGFEKKVSLWKEDAFPEVPSKDMILYKLNVRGFSMDGSGVKEKGTFAGLTEKIPYFKELGVTSLEVMPIYEFEEFILPEEIVNPRTWEKNEGDMIEPLKINASDYKVNLWGYTAGNYFAPKSSYSSSEDAAKELKTLIHALHENGIELIMEMFFVNGMNPSLILDVLRHWVVEYHVDGFSLIGDNLPLQAITGDMILRRTKLIYYGFDSDMLANSKYGNLFISNDDFMYPVRKLLNRMEGRLYEFAAQMRRQGEGYSFINYICSNNGFTLNDLFSYGEKHNEANGENNQDGWEWNFSSGCGEEGPTRKKKILEIRNRQIKNALCAVLLSQSVPMILAGDEFGNSQGGNNNAYCQDNRTGWVSWSSLKSHADIFEFTKSLIKFRKEHPSIRMERPMQMTDYRRLGLPDLSYHCEHPWVNEISANRFAVGMMYCGGYGGDDFGSTVYICYNFHAGMQLMALPKLPKGKCWACLMKTAEGDGKFSYPPAILSNQTTLMIGGQSVTILTMADEPVVVRKSKAVSSGKKQTETPKAEPSDAVKEEEAKETDGKADEK